MKKFVLLISITITCLLGWNCTKYTFDQSLPQVQIVSANLINSDTLMITGNVVSAGSTAIQNVGFAYSNQPNFDIISNQVLLNGTTGKFSMYLMVYPDSTYYFKCFATNANGYAASGNLKYTVIPIGPQTAPCAGSLSTNYVVDGGLGYNIIDVNTYTGGGATYGNYELATDNGGNEVIDIFFRYTPTNGVYTTADPTNLSTDPNPYDCGISIDNSYFANAGGKVYISINGSTITYTFCSILYNNGSTNVSLSGMLVSP